MKKNAIILKKSSIGELCIDNNGITMVALIITIIVMLVLAGIGISITTGIIEKTQYSTFVTEMANIEEAVNMYMLEKNMEIAENQNNAEEIVTFATKPTLEELPTELKQEILYVRAKINNPETVEESASEYDSNALTIDDLFYVDNEVAGKEKAYVYDDKSKSIFKAQPVIIKGKSMFGYDYGKIVGVKGLLTVQTEEQEEQEEELPHETELLSGYIGIYTIEDLQNVKNNLNKNYMLMTNIDLSSIENWTPIGTQSTPFTGTFNGNNYKIKNMKIIGSDDYRGLFGYSSGTIRKVIIKDMEISGKNYVGGLVGYNSGNVQYCKVIGKIIGGQNYIGGLIGQNVYLDNTVSNNDTEIDVDISNQNYTISSLGGLIGYTSITPINYNNSKININIQNHNGNVSNIGGMIGNIFYPGTYSNSINFCEVIGNITIALDSGTATSIGGIGD